MFFVACEGRQHRSHGERMELSCVTFHLYIRTVIIKNALLVVEGSSEAPRSVTRLRFVSDCV